MIFDHGFFGYGASVDNLAPQQEKIATILIQDNADFVCKKISSNWLREDGVSLSGLALVPVSVFIIDMQSGKPFTDQPVLMSSLCDGGRNPYFFQAATRLKTPMVYRSLAMIQVTFKNLFDPGGMTFPNVNLEFLGTHHYKRSIV